MSQNYDVLPQRVDNVTECLSGDLGPAAEGAEHPDIRGGPSGNITRYRRLNALRSK